MSQFVKRIHGPHYDMLVRTGQLKNGHIVFRAQGSWEPDEIACFKIEHLVHHLGIHEYIVDVTFTKDSRLRPSYSYSENLSLHQITEFVADEVILSNFRLISSIV